jgi:hypothetical protein
LQLNWSHAALSASFAAWAKCLHQRRFQSLSSAAEALQRQMHSIEGMYNTQMAAVAGERDALQSQVQAEREKVSAAVTPLSFASGLVLYRVYTL